MTFSRTSRKKGKKSRKKWIIPGNFWQNPGKKNTGNSWLEPGKNSVNTGIPVIIHFFSF